MGWGRGAIHRIRLARTGNRGSSSRTDFRVTLMMQKFSFGSVSYDIQYDREYLEQFPLLPDSIDALTLQALPSEYKFFSDCGCGFLPSLSLFRIGRHQLTMVGYFMSAPLLICDDGRIFICKELGPADLDDLLFFNSNLLGFFGYIDSWNKFLFFESRSKNDARRLADNWQQIDNQGLKCSGFWRFFMEDLGLHYNVDLVKNIPFDPFLT